MFAVLVAFQIFAAGLPSIDPFAVLQPSVTVSVDERRQLDGGRSIARALPSQDLEIAIFAAVPVHIDGDRLVAWMRRVEELKKSRYVLAIGRFSDPPRLEDLDRLALDDRELADVRVCRPGDCALKLSATEMAQLQRAAAEAEPDWKPAVQRAFRRAVLRRVQMYLADGSIAAYEDQKGQVSPAARFASLLERSVFLTEHLPRFAEHLRAYPRATAPGIESFVYWSREHLAGDPIISVTHVSILRSQDPGLPDALVAGKAIFATHYLNALLNVTAIMRGTAGEPNYLVYLNRSEVDVLGGAFGGLMKWFAQRRLRAEAADVLGGLRTRLERGEPPPIERKGSP